MKLFNRELSWLSFNERVLQESLDQTNPLVERIRFLGIYSNNMDEFFRVRVASVRRLIQIKRGKIEGFNGSPKALLKEIKSVVMDQQRLFELSYQKLIRELRDNHILQTDENHLKANESDFVQTYFREKIRPQIVPIMLSSKRRFPQLKDNGNYLAIKLTDFEKPKVKYALIEIPKNASRFVIIPTEEGAPKKIILLDDIIRHNITEIFRIFKYDSIDINSFKITRDAELDVDDDISKSYLEKMKDSVEMRKSGDTVRFVYDSSMPIDLLEYLMDALNLKPGQNIIPGGTYHNFKDFMNFPDFGNASFSFKKRKPLPHPDFSGNEALIKKILKKDILLTYPFQTFQHIIDILREAAIDPKVISIKINLYRVAPNSHIINALISAAKNGVKVTAIIELKARFDEANNIKWSNFLEENGVDVLFGVQNLKVHSKLFIIKRKSSGNKTESIAHIGTGNFHEKTANIYTDCSLLTSDKTITREVEKVFTIFRNNIDRSVFRELIVSPFNIRRKFYRLIDQEIKYAKNGEPAKIEIKLNNLVDSKIINKLYQASQAGVEIKCIIRGICSLIPGVKGLSENITIRSIVGQYLEHTRIIVFNNGGNPLYYISSADWMTRNLDRRIEVTVPIFDQELQQDLRFMLNAYFRDNQKARIIDELQRNKNVESELKEAYNSQNEIYRYFKSKIK